jgi:hypothetical protein
VSADSGPAEKRATSGTDAGMLAVLCKRRDSLSVAGRRERLQWLATGRRPTPPAAFRELYERPDPNEPEDVGICCSGGGIRSAAFNLGALQELQRREVLQNSKYLSAVSGGSYIAAAFCMVAKTWDAELHPDGRTPDGDPVDDSDPALVTDDAPPFEPGSPEEQYLRNHLGYLAPDGLARLYLALRMLAGMLINVVTVGLPVFLAGVLGGWAVDAHYGGLDDGFQVPQWVWIPVVGVAGLSLGVALLGILLRPRRDWQRLLVETWQVRFFLLASGAALALLAVPWTAREAFVSGNVAVGDFAVPGTTALSSIAALAAAAFAQLRGHVKDQEKAAKAVQGRLGRFAKPVREALVSLVVMLVGPLLLLAVCALGVLVGDLSARTGDPIDFGPLGAATPALLVWIGGPLALLGFLWAVVDLTSVSLHPFYRRRLASAFALKRVSAHGEPVAREREFDHIVELSKSGIEPGPCRIKSWPMLVVCAAANISDPGATPPGRAVASFTFSPRAIGGPVTGAEKTDVYENLRRNRKRDVTLPAAVAMSGAAISPTMGKLTRRSVTFLLGLANIRLGVWVPNPLHIKDAPEGKEVVEFPRRPRPHYLLKEMLGRNRLGDKFLYVTDGGHYENLGLVELLRRGCRTIYCFDAGGGSSASALVDAIALARTELNVRILMEVEADELDAKPVSDDANAPRRAKRDHAVGKIIYPPAAGQPAVEGTLVYARSVVTANSPWQLTSLQTADPVFPHHSTFDQFFDDQKFEGYRLLGEHVADTAAELAAARRAAPAAAPTNGGEATAPV